MDKTQENSMKSSRKMWIIGVCLVLIGVLIAFGLRFLLVSPPAPTHYHANFGLYVNDVKDEFKNFTFYEEVQACSADASSDPRTRVHMHNQKNYEVHVHDQGATWGHFMANLGYGLTNTALQTKAGLFVNDVDGKKLSFILNGQPVTDIYNRTIADDDVLLINYGANDEKTLNERFKQIPRTADELDKGTDPAACTGSQAESISDRFKRTLGI